MQPYADGCHHHHGHRLEDRSRDKGSCNNFIFMAHPSLSTEEHAYAAHLFSVVSAVKATAPTGSFNLPPFRPTEHSLGTLTTVTASKTSYIGEGP